MRPFTGRADREEPAFALDHDGARVERGRRDERDAARLAFLDTGTHVFRTGARLAEAAPGQEQPDPPVTRRRLLRLPRLSRRVPLVFLL